MKTTAEIIQNARRAGQALPAFNIPYLPMMALVVQGVADLDSFALITVARLEWIKFESGSPAAVMAEFRRCEKPDFVRIHLDHVPVIDENDLSVDALPIIREAIDLGYQSVMIDGSRLDLAGNRRATVCARDRLRLAVGRYRQRPQRDLDGDERPERGRGPAEPRPRRTAGRGHRHPPRATRRLRLGPSSLACCLSSPVPGVHP